MHEENHPTDDTMQTEEKEQAEKTLWEEKKFNVLKSCLLKLLGWNCSCGQEVELNTSIRCTMLVVK